MTLEDLRKKKLTADEQRADTILLCVIIAVGLLITYFSCHGV